jgi:hypothetical protein
MGVFKLIAESTTDKRKERNGLLSNYIKLGMPVGRDLSKRTLRLARSERLWSTEREQEETPAKNSGKA